MVYTLSVSAQTYSGILGLRVWFAHTEVVEIVQVGTLSVGPKDSLELYIADDCIGNSLKQFYFIVIIVGLKLPH